jgi:hypothetical protein
MKGEVMGRCKDCTWSITGHHEWDVLCANPIVNNRDPWFLGKNSRNGSDTVEERSKKWFGKCGIKGKLFK